MEEENCVFCKIVRGELSSKKYYEDEDVIAIQDANPIAPVHILVIPKKHIVSLMDLDDEKLHAKILEVIKTIANKKDLGIDVLEGKTLAERGFRVTTNIGEDGGQAVKHLHFHILGGTKLPTR
jgi:histidine triad (HIT) family protein